MTTKMKMIQKLLLLLMAFLVIGTFSQSALAFGGMDFAEIFKVDIPNVAEYVNRDATPVSNHPDLSDDILDDVLDDVMIDGDATPVSNHPDLPDGVLDGVLDDVIITGDSGRSSILRVCDNVNYDQWQTFATTVRNDLESRKVSLITGLHDSMDSNDFEGARNKVNGLKELKADAARHANSVDDVISCLENENIRGVEEEVLISQLRLANNYLVGLQNEISREITVAEQWGFNYMNALFGAVFGSNRNAGSGSNEPTQPTEPTEPTEPVDSDADGVLDTVDNCPSASNPDQLDTDGDDLGDACDSVDNSGDGNPPADNPADDTPLTAEEIKYQEYKDDYDSYKDSFYDIKKSYRKAVDDDDSSDIEKYKGRLNDLDNDLDTLAEKIDDFVRELENDGLTAEEQTLVGKLDNLEDDVQKLREKITDLFEENQVEDNQRLDSLPQTSHNVDNNVPEFVFEPQQPSNDLNKEGTSWQEVRSIAWVSAGIIVLIAVIIFLLALLLK